MVRPTALLHLTFLLIIGLGCSRAIPGSGTLVVNWGGQSGLSLSAPFESLIQGTSSFGGVGVENVDSMDCIGVMVMAAGESNSCTTTGGSQIQFTDVAGLVGRNQSLSLQVASGPGRLIRVIGVDLLSGETCPTLAALDRMQISRPRVIAEITKDLTSGENVIEVTPNMSGAEIRSCTSAKLNGKSTICDLVAKSSPGSIETDELIVHLADGVSLSALQTKFSSLGMTSVGGWPDINSYHFDLAAGQTAAATAKILCESPMVQFVEPMLDTFTPRFHSNLIDLSDDTNFNSVVAIVGTGVDLSHIVFSDFTDSLWSNADEFGGDEDGNGLLGDYFGWNFFDDNDDLTDGDGFGTAMAGIALKQAVDIMGAPDVSPISLMTVKVMDSSGATDPTRIAAGVLYAAQMNADVIFVGVGSTSHSEIVRRALIYANNRGALIVAPAGNSTADNDLAGVFPASFNIPNVISVGAHTVANVAAAFTNFGETSVDLFAPGVTEVTLAPADSFTSMSGTTIAAAAVAGAAALAKNEATQLSGYQVKQLILDTTVSEAGLANLCVSGGRLDLPQLITIAPNLSADIYSQPLQ